MDGGHELRAGDVAGDPAASGLERRLFRREFGPEKLPLDEAYAAIWASDDLNYNGGGTAHASAYNYFANNLAARVARMLGARSRAL